MQQYNKFWVAAIMGILTLLGAYGFVPQEWVSEQRVVTIVSIIGPVLVYLIPNRSA